PQAPFRFTKGPAGGEAGAFWQPANGDDATSGQLVHVVDGNDEGGLFPWQGHDGAGYDNRHRGKIDATLGQNRLWLWRARGRRLPNLCGPVRAAFGQGGGRLRSAVSVEYRRKARNADGTARVESYKSNDWYKGNEG